MRALTVAIRVNKIFERLESGKPIFHYFPLKCQTGLTNLSVKRYKNFRCEMGLGNSKSIGYPKFTCETDLMNFNQES